MEDKNEIIPLETSGTWPKTNHVWDKDAFWAITVAAATGRPLLIKGEPGIGKSQVARAAAQHFGVPFIPAVINEGTSRDDLFFSYDAVGRLSQAQKKGGVANATHFITPGPLWWAISPNTAAKNTAENPYTKNKGKRTNHIGCVALIDEIDKADPSLPNGMLEALANGGFTSLEPRITITRDPNWQPLIIITTNDERELPAAFIRRCLVLNMRFPEENAEEFLINRAHAHFPTIPEDVAETVANQLLEDRREAKDNGIPLPGAAEFLDVLKALVELTQQNPTKKEMLAIFDQIRDMNFRKHQN